MCLIILRKKTLDILNTADLDPSLEAGVDEAVYDDDEVGRVVESRPLQAPGRGHGKDALLLLLRLYSEPKEAVC